MPLYRIIWEIDEEAESALEAARAVARRLTPKDDIYTAIEWPTNRPFEDGVPELIDLLTEGCD